MRISIKGIVRHSTVAAVSTHHDLAMLPQIPSSCLTADPVTCTSGQSPGEHSIKEWVSSDIISEEVENSSEPIAPRLSCSTDKSIVNTRNRGNCDKKTETTLRMFLETCASYNNTGGFCAGTLTRASSSVFN